MDQGLLSTSHRVSAEFHESGQIAAGAHAACLRNTGVVWASRRTGNDGLDRRVARLTFLQCMKKAAARVSTSSEREVSHFRIQLN